MIVKPPSFVAVVASLAWLVSAAAGVCLGVTARRRLEPGDDRAANALWFSLLAMVPSVAFALEYAARLAYYSWKDGDHRWPYDFWLFIPLAAWLLGGPVSLGISFWLLAPNRGGGWLVAARIAHAMEPG